MTPDPPDTAPMSSSPAIVLASQSPRRSQLLTMLGLDHEVRPAHVDERYEPGEEAAAHAQRLAREKAQVVAAARQSSIVVGSDTVVVIDGDVLGKPRDRREAVGMLLRLQGRSHTVATGLAVAYRGRILSAVEQVEVRFRTFGPATAERYVATGEPDDKAGAYGIQGFGAALVERIEGDYFAVMGLPVCRLIRLFEELGWQYGFPGILGQ